MSNILETTLAMLGIEKYIKEFRRYGIDATVLPLLSSNDLRILGIEDEELRKRILRQFSSLPTPNDMNVDDLIVDYEYMINVLSDIDHHLLLLNASLSYAFHNDNIKGTDIKLSNPTKCLLQCIGSIEQQTDLLYKKFSPIAIVKNNNKGKYFVFMVFITTTAVYAVKRYLK